MSWQQPLKGWGIMGIVESVGIGGQGLGSTLHFTHKPVDSGQCTVDSLSGCAAEASAVSSAERSAAPLKSL